MRSASVHIYSNTTVITLVNRNGMPTTAGTHNPPPELENTWDVGSVAPFRPTVCGIVRTPHIRICRGVLFVCGC